MTKKIEETTEHRRLKNVVKDIAKTCGFNYDSEVALNFSGSKNKDGGLVDERSMDVAVYGKNKDKKFLFIFECKGGKNFDSISKEISAWEADIKKLTNDKAKILTSDENKIKDNDLKKLDEVKICYVFGESFDKKKSAIASATLRKRGFFGWDSSALAYYKKISNTVGRWIKYEIFKEFGVNFESSGSWSEKAVKIKQGDLEMFIFGAYPSVLLKIGYVSRRASGKPEAYQRILNKDRIKKISKFVSSRGALLPNVIIIAFDTDAEIQNKINYTNGNINFPKSYCSAWIIDGQHRAFGFLETKFEDVDPDDPSEEFKLPVVAFKNLDEVLQNRTFVSINYNQKKIDPTLLCDLATSVPDLQNELTWPSHLVSRLNEVEPLKDKVKISELDKGRSISLSSFARYGLLESLLGYDKKSQQYKGALNNYAPLNSRALLKNKTNQNALKKQSDLLKRYFEGVALNTKNTDSIKDPWSNTKDYSLLKPAGINALLLVLSRIMEKHADANLDFKKYLKPLSKQSFKREYVARQGGGWKGFRGLANVILRKLNKKHKSDNLRLFGEKDKI